MNSISDLNDLNNDIELKLKELNVLVKKRRKLFIAFKKDHEKLNGVKLLSTEIRTPLNSIIGFVELLLEENFGSLNGEQIEVLTDIKESAYKLVDVSKNIEEKF